MADKARRERLIELLASFGDSIGADWGTHLRAGNCPICGSKINEADFRDQLSRDEYALSHMCQKCQDEVFKP